MTRFSIPDGGTRVRSMFGRRAVLAFAASAPIVACRKPETPLAHLNGESWVHGVYELHAKRYLDVQTGAEVSSHGAYRVLAQKGVNALEGLQVREVPFYMRVDQTTNAFKIERNVPERLTFTADMSEADRAAAQAGWKKAREHIHTDYFEINRLNWAMTTLLQQLVGIHTSMEEAEIEQFKIVRDLADLRGGSNTPYQLPKGVSRTDYEDVLLLLLVRLEDDRRRLAVIEASIAAVGLTSRSTDAGSGSFAENIQKVLLAVIRDAEATAPKAAIFPKEKSAHQKASQEGRAIQTDIEKSPEYVAWKRNEEAKQLEKVGVLFSIADAITHLPTSAVFQSIVTVWRGNGDYLDYLKTIARFVPHGGAVGKTVLDAIAITDKARKITRAVSKGNLTDAAGAAISDQAGAVLNTATQFGRARLDKQIAFLTDQKELADVREAVRSTELVTKPMPAAASVRAP